MIHTDGKQTIANAPQRQLPLLPDEERLSARDLAYESPDYQLRWTDEKLDTCYGVEA